MGVPARHLLAGVGAGPARLGAPAHLLVVPQGFAGLRAGHADLGAGAAGDSVVVGAADHEVRARLANLRAVEQEAEVLRACVFAPLLQAVLDRFEADLVARRARLDAASHVLVDSLEGKAWRQVCGSRGVTKRHSGAWCINVLAYRRRATTRAAAATTASTGTRPLAGVFRGVASTVKSLYSGVPGHEKFVPSG